jgi:CMP-N-acetylneuraminic acid synthetase
MTGEREERDVAGAVSNAGGLKIMGLITARGGSKGVPRKNLVPLGGRPLISYTIDAALESGLVDRLLVTTDDAEIAEVSRKLGAETPFVRPPRLSGDWDPTYPVVVHAVEWMAEHEDYVPDYIMVLQPTSPLRSSKDIQKAVAIALENDADGVISVYEPKQHPFWMFELTEDGRFPDFDPRTRELTRRQSLKPQYMLNGAIYLVKREVILRQDHFYTDRTHALVMPLRRSMDIDSLADVRIAELIQSDPDRQEDAGD